jgi:hypothetical protein
MPICRTTRNIGWLFNLKVDVDCERTTRQSAEITKKPSIFSLVFLEITQKVRLDLKS